MASGYGRLSPSCTAGEADQGRSHLGSDLNAPVLDEEPRNNIQQGHVPRTGWSCKEIDKRVYCAVETLGENSPFVSGQHMSSVCGEYNRLPTRVRSHLLDICPTTKLGSSAGCAVRRQGNDVHMYTYTQQRSVYKRV